MKECPACHRCFADHFNHCGDDGALLVSSIVGETVLEGRYELKRRLGQGGMGAVYEARHNFLKTIHAIKVILPEFLVGNDPEFVRRFRQEAMAAANIRHRNVIRVTDYGVTNGTMPFLVMDFIRGRLLQDVLAQERILSPVRSLEMMEPIMAGVGAAHRLGIVHRDLKPLNIMIEEDSPLRDAVKVLDFGLAKIKAGEFLGSFAAAKSSGIMGSPPYMAPEQWSDEEFDSRTDIYSLGIILYQMLTGTVPFKGPSAPSIMKKHLMDEPPRFAASGVSVHPRIEAVVRHSLEKSPANRPQSVDEFIGELRAAINAAESTLERIQSITPDTLLDTFIPATIEVQRTPSLTFDDSETQASDSGAERLLHEAEVAARQAEAEAAAARAAEEERAREDEQRRTAARAAELERLRLEAEYRRRVEEEEAARKRVEEERAAAEEDRRKRAAEEDRLRKEEEARRARAIEAARREEEERRQQEEQRKLAEEAERRRQEEEARQRKEDEARQKAAEEERLRQEAERQRLAEEAKRHEEELQRRLELERIAAEDEQRREAARAAELERLRLEEEYRLRVEREETACKRAEEDRVAAAEEERRRAAEGQARRRETAEAAARAAEEERWRKEEEVQRARAIEAARRDEEERRQQEEQRKLAEEAERRRQEEEARIRAAEEAEPQELVKTMAVPRGFEAHAVFPPVHPGHEKKSRVRVITLAAVAILLGIAGILYLLLSSRGQGVGTANSGTNNDANVNGSSSNQADNGSGGKEPYKPELVEIAGGKFLMGRSDVSTKDPLALIQYPAHEVIIKPFLIDRTEVTNAEYADFVRETHYKSPEHWQGDTPPAGKEMLPVVNVSFQDAQAFAEWRSKREGVTYRLPREEEWEFAARGTGNLLYPWGNEWADSRVNLNGDGTRQVGSYSQGATVGTGVLDMIGNVEEWTSSEASLYPGNDKLDPLDKGSIVVRGGSYKSMDARDVKMRGGRPFTATVRDWYKKTTTYPSLGFRLVRDPP